MVKKTQLNAKMASVTLVSILFIFSGPLLDITDYIFRLPDAQWSYLYNQSKELQIIGAVLIAFTLCQYKFLHTKVLLFLAILFKTMTLIINGLYFDRVFSSFTLGIIVIIYLLLVFRFFFIYNIKERTPKPGDAFYILFPVSSFWGLMQAVFLPWHPARYETRMVCDGEFLWSVFQKQFIRTKVDDLNLDKIQGVRVSWGRKLLDTERALLDSRVGKKAQPGINDCRKLLVAGKI